jgi:hypothetical protein
VIASNTWWGQPTGPFDPSVVDPCTNPGGAGVGVSDFVNYCPFLSGEAPVTDVPGPQALVTQSRFVSAGPVPAAGAVTFVLDVASGTAGQLDIYDLAGRLVWAFDLAPWMGATARLAWDGSNASGGRVRPGVYLARFRSAGLTETRHVVVSR